MSLAFLETPETGFVTTRPILCFAYVWCVDDNTDVGLAHMALQSKDSCGWFILLLFFFHWCAVVCVQMSLSHGAMRSSVK